MEPFLGQIQPVGFNFAPRGWTLCDGQLLPINSYQALFSLLGTTFGGDGRTTFALPDLRGRSIVGVGNGAGISDIRWGEKGGAEQITLTTNNLPAHRHVVTATTNDATLDEPAAGVRFGTTGTPIYAPANSGTGTVSMAGDSTSQVGGSQPFQSRNPFLGIYVCIALQGIFPSRN